MADPACPAVDLSNSIGVILASVLTASVFYGVSCLQTFIYFMKYPRDGAVHKTMVLALWLINTANQMLISVGIWQYLVSHFGDFAFLGAFHIPLPLSTIISSIVASIVQSFFVWRIYIFSKHNIIFPILMAPAIVVQPVLCIIYLVGSLRNPDLEEFARLNDITFAANGVAAGVDVSIAICMVVLLIMGRTGFTRTDRMIVRLLIITINTGVWTALFALMVVILSAAYPGELVNTATYFSLCSLYVNTLLANLNSREFVRNPGRSEASGVSVPIQRSRYGTGNEPFNVYMETTKTTDTLVGPPTSNTASYGKP